MDVGAVSVSLAALALSGYVLWKVNHTQIHELPRKKPLFKPFGKGYIRSLEDVEEEARATAHDFVFQYIQYTAGKSLAVKKLHESFDRICLKPRMLRDVSVLDIAVEVSGTCILMLTYLQLFGQTISPIIIAPTGFHALVHEDAELATARAAEKTGCVMAYNYMYSNTGAEAVASACTHKWLQLYLLKDRELAMQGLVDAKRFGYSAIVVTCDHSHDRVKDYNMPIFANEGDETFLMERMRFPNSEFVLKGRKSESVGETDTKLTWKDFQWFTEQTALPVICKGVLCAEDALLAVQHGAKAIIVSNHGGRQFDAGPSPLDVLAEVVAAVSVPVLYDSGIRSGTHIAKALAVGARAVLIGRPVMWGLAAHGQEGVEEVLGVLKRELEYDMRALGCTHVADLKEHLMA